MASTARHRLLALLACFSLGIALPAGAEDRALLVGVGNYQYRPDRHMDGIDLDLDMMQKVVAILGYSPDQTKVLLDQDATLSAVVSAMRTWVVDGVQADDRVLIYISSHGTRVPDTNGDEEDGIDEGLIMHDFQSVDEKGQSTATGVLLDDDIGVALERIPSRQVLVIVDACHSGTATKSLKLKSLRSGTSEGQSKYFRYPGMPHAATRGLRLISDQDNVLSLAATQDDEEAIATKRGSLFTRGIAKAVSEANEQGLKLTPRGLKDRAKAYVHEQLRDAPSRRFHPHLSGNLALADTPLIIRPLASGHGPTWTKVEQLIAGMDVLSLNTQGDKREYRPRELLELELEVPRPGYLNIINIDASDKPIVIFPNRWTRDSQVPAGRIRIPGDQPFQLPAGAPFGPTLIVALFSDAPLNLFADGDGERDAMGKMLTAFPDLSAYGLRGFTAEAIPQRRAAGKLQVQICPQAGCTSKP